MTDFSIEFFEATIYLFEKEKGSAISDFENEMISKFLGDETELNKIKEEIVFSIENDSMPLKLRGDAFYTLGKTYDPQLKVFFIKHLKKEVKKAEGTDYNALYQIMIALDNLGENIFNQKTASVLEKDENFRAAQAYIDSIESQKI